MTNGTDPTTMTGQERLAEVSMLLSLAMMRLWLKRRAACGQQRAISRELRQVCLELPAEIGPHGTIDPTKE